MKIYRVVCLPEGMLPAPSVLIDGSFRPDEEIVQKESGELTFDGAPESFRQLGWSMEKKDVMRCCPEGKAELVTRKTVDGERTFVENAAERKVGSAWKAEVHFSIGEKDRILGLGQHEEGISSYRNCVQYLYQNNMQIPMPVFLSPEGYAVFFDAECMMIYEEKDNVITMKLEAADRLSYYVIIGSLEEQSRALRRMTGKAELLPEWAFGYMQSRERYKTQDELVEIAEIFEKYQIPVSCLVQDWHTWEEGKWGNKHLDPSRYPDLKKAVDALHKKGIGFLLSVWPNAAQGCEDNEELLAAGKLFANLSTYDAFDPEARAIYWKQCDREIFSAGTDGWWCDSSEPFTPDWGGEKKLSDRERFEKAKGELCLFMDERQANSYALYHAEGIYENQKKTDAAKRVINLTRSGYPGSQKYGTILWSGDIAARWEVMEKQIVEGQQMAASGIPYWTLDCGAFFAGNQISWMKWSNSSEGIHPWFWNGEYEKGNEDLGYRELYTRWLQFSAFLPVMRSHGTDTFREPWFFGEPGTKYYDTIVKYIRLRYHLVPYIYSLAWKVYREDGLFMRSLLFDYPEEESAKHPREYLFGDFLVCPVTFPVEYGPDASPVNREAKMEVYLPGEDFWYDYETGECRKGSQTVSADVPVEHMPLYVRGGSILFVDPENGRNLYREQKEERAALEIFGGRDGAFTCYTDAGNGYGYQKGEYAAVRIEWNDAEQKLTLSDVEGYRAYPREWSLLLRMPDGKKKNLCFSYEGKKKTVAL